MLTRSCCSGRGRRTAGGRTIGAPSWGAGPAAEASVAEPPVADVPATEVLADPCSLVVRSLTTLIAAADSIRSDTPWLDSQRDLLRQAADGGASGR